MLEYKRKEKEGYLYKALNALDSAEAATLFVPQLPCSSPDTSSADKTATAIVKQIHLSTSSVMP